MYMADIVWPLVSLIPREVQFRPQRSASNMNSHKTGPSLSVFLSSVWIKTMRRVMAVPVYHASERAWGTGSLAMLMLQTNLAYIRVVKPGAANMASAAYRKSPSDCHTVLFLRVLYLPRRKGLKTTPSRIRKVTQLTPLGPFSSWILAR